MKDCLGIILARTGSRRVKNKNFLKIEKQFIFEIPLKEAIKTKRFVKFVVSSDKKKKIFFNNIFKSKIYSNKLIFHSRNKNMLKNNYHMIDVVKHIIDLDKIKKLKFKYVFMIYTTAILINKYDIINMLKIMKKNEKSNYGCSVQTICKYPAPIEWAFSLKKNKLKKKFNYKIKSSDRYKEYYYDTGGLQLFNKYYFKKNTKKIDLGYDIGKIRGIDVDDKEDYKIARTLYLNKVN